MKPAATSKPVRAVTQPPSKNGIQSNIDKFIALFSGGVASLVEAGKLLVQMLNEDPSVCEKIISQQPGITASMLSKLEAVGRGAIHPNTLLLPDDRARRVAKLPFAEQERITTAYVPVVRRVAGTWTAQPKRVDEMTRPEFEAAFEPETGRIRKPEEQVKHVEASEARAEQRDRRFYVTEGKIHFCAGAEFTAAELEEVLAKLKADGLIGLEKAMKDRQVKV